MQSLRDPYVEGCARYSAKDVIENTFRDGTSHLDATIYAYESREIHCEKERKKKREK